MGETCSNILTITLLLLPESFGFIRCQVTLHSDSLDERRVNSFSHPLGAPAYKDTAVDGIDDGPDEICLCQDFLLDVAARSDARLHHVANPLLVLSPLARV